MEYNQKDLMAVLRGFFKAVPSSTPITVVSVNNVNRVAANRYEIKVMLVLNYTTMMEAHATVVEDRVTALHIPGTTTTDESGVQAAYPTNFKSVHSTIPIQSSLERLTNAHQSGKTLSETLFSNS